MDLVTPRVFVEQHRLRMQMRWGDRRLKSYLTEAGSTFLSGIPLPALMAMTVYAAGPSEDRIEDGIHHIGYFGVPAGVASGPAPNPQANSPDNVWGQLATDPQVFRELGQRTATMAPNGYQSAVQDQVVIGLANAYRHVVALQSVLPTDMRAVPGSQWWFVQALLALFLGVDQASRMLRKRMAEVVWYPASFKFGGLITSVVSDPGATQREAQAVLYAWQILEVGKQLAARYTSQVIDFFTIAINNSNNTVRMMSNREEDKLVSIARYGVVDSPTQSLEYPTSTMTTGIAVLAAGAVLVWMITRQKGIKLF